MEQELTNLLKHTEDTVKTILNDNLYLWMDEVNEMFGKYNLKHMPSSKYNGIHFIYFLIYKGNLNIGIMIINPGDKIVSYDLSTNYNLDKYLKRVRNETPSYNKKNKIKPNVLTIKEQIEYLELHINQNN